MANNSRFSVSCFGFKSDFFTFSGFFSNSSLRLRFLITHGFGLGGLCCGSLGLCGGDALALLFARVVSLVNLGLQAARFGAGVVKVPGAHVANRHADGAAV